MDDDYDYAAEEDIIEYGDYDVMDAGDGDTGINFEDMFIEAENSNNPEKYHEIIELEKDNSGQCKWAFKCYEKLCLIAIKNKNFADFQTNFEKMFELYPRVDDFDRQDTIRNCNYCLVDPHDAIDEEFVIEVLRYMLNTLKEKEVEREVMNTGLQFAKRLFILGRYEDLGEVKDQTLYV